MTSGFNRVFQGPFPIFDPLFSSEYIFIFDITGHSPIFKQAIPIPNAYHGIVWDPVSGNHAFYVSGGMGDAPFRDRPYSLYALPNNGDNIHIVTQQADGSWKPTAELDLGQDSASVVSGHSSGNGLPVPDNQFASVNSAVFVAPMAAGLAISNDGQTLIVANYYNDSITIFTGGLSVWQQQWVADAGSAQGGQGLLQGTELDLRPGKAASSPAPGTPGGEYPFWVVIAGNSGPGATAYVSSLARARNRRGEPGRSLRQRNQRPRLLFNCRSVRYRADSSQGPAQQDDAEQRAHAPLCCRRRVGHCGRDQPCSAAIRESRHKTGRATVNTVIESIPVIAPPSLLQAFALTQYTGANTNSVTLSPDETQLYVTNGNLNDIAVVALTGTNTGDHVVGSDSHRLVSKFREL